MATEENLSIDQGTDVLIILQLANTDQSAKNLTNHTVYAWVKKSLSDDSDQATKFSTLISNAAAGEVELRLTNTQTDALDYRKKYFYDVELHHLDSDSNTIVERVLEGTIKINPSVTK